MFDRNRFYGHRQIYLAYAGRSDRPVSAYLQHGWSMAPAAGSGPTSLTNRRPWIPRLYWSARQRNEAAAHGAVNAHAIGSPMLYLAALMDLARQPRRASPIDSVLVYPEHSVSLYRSRVVASHVDTLRDLEESRDRGLRLTVCLHPADAQQTDIVKAYRALGCRVTSHSRSMSDPHHLYRQAFAILSHDEVWSYAFGTAALYSGYLGTPVLFRGLASEDPARPSRQPARRAFNERHDIFARLQELGSLQTFAEEELGLSSILSPTELARLLGTDGLARLRAKMTAQGLKARSRVTRSRLGDV